MGSVVKLLTNRTGKVGVVGGACGDPGHHDNIDNAAVAHDLVPMINMTIKLIFIGVSLCCQVCIGISL